jgi:succinyldiaminopimelate transaminase
VTEAPTTGRPAPFVPPPYPYDRLDPLRAVAAEHAGGMVDLSIGSPFDAPPPAVIEAMAGADARGYPASNGVLALREAAAGWLDRFLGVSVDPDQVAACIGTKELVAGMPQWLRLRTPERDTVLYPEISYPTYEMGATLAGCRAVPVPVRADWTIDLGAIDDADAARALCLWVNTPGNPAGGLDDLAAAAEWGRSRGVPVLSDECYVAFTWDGPARTILHHGSDGVLAVHSLSKRSNLAGGRAGFYAGDLELVTYLREVRKHAGFMVPAPVQAAAIAALADEDHVDAQRDRYHRRLVALRDAMAGIGIDVPMPGGGFYLWVPAPDGDAWSLTERLARDGGAIVSPGEFYGEAGRGHVRIAAVQPDERIAVVVERLRQA